MLDLQLRHKVFQTESNIYYILIFKKREFGESYLIKPLSILNDLLAFNVETTMETSKNESFDLLDLNVDSFHIFSETTGYTDSKKVFFKKSKMLNKFFSIDFKSIY